MTKLYIAYGSNLNIKAMMRRCPTAKKLGHFFLTDARLVFRGVADVEYSKGDKVPCGLWSINQADERALDRYEGVSTGFYHKNEDIVLKFAGRPQNALIYLMNSEGVYPPSQNYYETVWQGYKDFGLDKHRITVQTPTGPKRVSYLREAAIRAYEDKEPDEQTRKRRATQLKSQKECRLVRMPESVALKRLELRKEVQA